MGYAGLESYKMCIYVPVPAGSAKQANSYKQEDGCQRFHQEGNKHQSVLKSEYIE